MKRFGYLYPQIITFENLLSAAHKAQKGKRFRPDVLEFNHNLESNLLTIQQELTDKTYQPGPYRTFHIHETKRRLISSAPYRDRVVHHALCNIITPIFENTFIQDSYANRVGYGTHKALKRFTKFCRSSTYILQCDIKKYFPNIDHQILKNLIRRKIKCQDTLWLIDLIIDNSNPQETTTEYFPEDGLLTPVERKRGLPIGNLTSQFFANIYLNEFDHFIKETLGFKKYLRYVDDFALFAEHKDTLKEARECIEDYLETLRLRIHPIKSQISLTKHGATFVGFRVLLNQTRVCNSNLCRGRKRFKKLIKQHQSGEITYDQIVDSMESWFSHLDHGDTYQLQQQIFSSLVSVRN